MWHDARASGRLRRSHGAQLLRTLLTAAVETGALEAMPDLPKAPPPGRKLPSAPSTDEVNAMLANAKGWAERGRGIGGACRIEARGGEGFGVS